MQAYAKLLMIGLLLGLAGSAAPATTGSPFMDMMRGMATGLALLGQNSSTSPTTVYPQIQALPIPGYPPFASGLPWAPSFPGLPPNLPYGASPYGSTPWPPPAPYAGGGNILSRLQGAWESSNGSLLLVRNNMARLYVSRDQYQDLYITAGPRYLWLRPVRGQSPTRYEHHIYRDRMVLRDGRGNSLVLRRYKPKTSDGNLP